MSHDLNFGGQHAEVSLYVFHLFSLPSAQQLTMQVNENKSSTFPIILPIKKQPYNYVKNAQRALFVKMCMAYEVAWYWGSDIHIVVFEFIHII